MSQKTSLCHTVNAPGEQKTFGSLKLLPSQAESFTLPVAAAALASWRRIFRRSSAAAASTTDERGQHTGRANMHACGGGGDSRLPRSDHGHERPEGRRVRCGCCAGVGGAGSLDTVISRTASACVCVCVCVCVCGSQMQQMVLKQHAHRGWRDADARGRGTANPAQYCGGHVEQARRRWKHQARVCLVVRQTLSRIQLSICM